MRTFAIALACFVLFSPDSTPAGDKKELQAAPLPTAIMNAKTVFLSNGGGSNVAYDAFYSKMKEWGRFEISGSPEKADLILEISYSVQNRGTHVWSYTNPDKTTQVYSRQIVDPQLILTIYDARTKNSLWSETDHRRLARREKNRTKEMINSAERLVDDIKLRMTRPR